MAWFADLAGKAENLLNNLDEQTGAALRNHNVVKSKKHEYAMHQDFTVPGQKKRPPTRLNSKKVSTATETKSNCVPTRKPSPTSHQARTPTKEFQDVNHTRSKKSPTRKPCTQHNLNHCPKTLVSDVKDSEIEDHYGLKQRRFSLPADLELLGNHNMTYKMQNLEVENAMLKNDLNVMNREVSELLDRLRRTEDGNVVNGFHKELSKTQIQFENAEMLNQKLELEKESQCTLLEELKQKINELTAVEETKHKEQTSTLETELNYLKGRNSELEEKIKQLTEKSNENNTTHIKLEKELRHAQSVIDGLQADLEKSREECSRLDKDWETYKLRVKSMLSAKDSEIKALHEGMSVTEDTKALVEQLELLKQERDELSESIANVRDECESLRAYTEQVEARHTAAERVVAALRDALKDEREACTDASSRAAAIAKELKALQMESSQTIASLRTALHEKEAELNSVRVTSSPSDSVALNVGEYPGVGQQEQQVRRLTDALVQRQDRLDALLQDNSALRIHLAKLQSKYNAEISAKRSKHSVVHVDSDRARRHPTPLSLSLRMGVAMKRNPLFRTFIIIYMVCLHLWVLTVLFTSTPDGHIPSQVKS